ncbi:MAG: hypothetical protein Kow0047_02190 [Anaerolineae bacterium]
MTQNIINHLLYASLIGWLVRSISGGLSSGALYNDIGLYGPSQVENQDEQEHEKGGRQS